MKHICSPCGLEFDSEAEYLVHQCSVAKDNKPTSAEFLKETTTPNVEAITASAIERGSEKK